MTHDEKQRAAGCREIASLPTGRRAVPSSLWHWGFIDHRSLVICHFAFALAALILLWSPSATPGLMAATNGTPSRNIGIEGQVSFLLPRPDYRPRPLDDRTEVILRIESVSPATNGQHRYVFFYMGLEPGGYSLADYLIRPDGSRPDELSELRFQARAILPEDHDGHLNAYVARPFPFIGGYRMFLGALAAAWVGGIIVFVLRNRRRRTVEVVAAPVAAPSLAEQMRPLVEAAAAGRLGTDGQAQLERLLTGYWREKLSLPDLRMAEALLRLKAHTDAGELLRALERWLHRPGGVPAAEVSALLEPYRFAASRQSEAISKTDGGGLPTGRPVEATR